MRSRIVLRSYHHNNTRKVAEAIANVIGASIVDPRDTDADDLRGYDLVGFGSGIDSGAHYREILDLADRLEKVDGKRCFLFSTSAVQGTDKVKRDHARLRGALLEKGYQVVGEFSCKGFNTNSFLKWFGGMNRNRPDRDDLLRAERFAAGLAP
jgi:flavodoxin